MLNVENQIVMLLIQMAHMCQPLNATEVLQLASDLTEGNEIQQEVLPGKRKICTTKKRQTKMMLEQECLEMDTGMDS